MDKRVLKKIAEWEVLRASMYEALEGFEDHLLHHSEDKVTQEWGQLLRNGIDAITEAIDRLNAHERPS